MNKEKKEAAQGGVSDEACISLLESFKERTKCYKEMYPLFTEEYLEKLIAHEKEVLDAIISRLKNRG